jgi:hypothetical protein
LTTDESRREPKVESPSVDAGTGKSDEDLFTAIAKPIYIGIGCAVIGIVVWVAKELLFPGVRMRTFVIVLLWSLAIPVLAVGWISKRKARQKR